jgi:hypothetical protein
LIYDRRSILIISFVILSLGSAIYVSIAAYNNLLLFRALDQIDAEQSYHVDKLSLLQSTIEGQSSLEVQASVDNPTAYSGLRLSGVAVTTIYFYAQSNSSITLFEPPTNSPNASETIGIPLGPDSTDSFAINIPITQGQTSQLLTFYNSYQGQAIGRVDLTVYIATYMESVTGLDVYTRTQDISLSIS